MKRIRNLLGGFVFFILAIIIVQFVFYSRNLELISSQPSSTWSKEVEVYEGAVVKKLDMLENGDGLIVAFLEGEQVKILKLDKDGVLIGESEMAASSKIWNLVLFQEGQNVMIAWCEKESGKSNAIIGRVDGELQYHKKLTKKDVININKMSKDSILLSGENNFTVMRNGVEFSKNANIEVFDGVAKDGKQYILYKDLESTEYIVDIYENNEITEILSMGTVPLTSSVGNHNQTLLVSDDEINIIYDRYMKGHFTDTKLISYNRSSKELQNGNFYIDGHRVFAFKKSGNEGYLIGVIDRSLDNRIYQRDIIECRIKNMSYFDIRGVSNTTENSMFASRSGDYIVYGDSIGYKETRLKVASMDSEFIKMQDKITSDERENAAMITFKGIGMTFANLFIIGYAWLLPSVIILAVAFFFNEKLNLARKKIVFAVCSGLIIISELMIAHGTFYIKFGFKLPESLTLALGLGLILVSFLVTLGKPYRKYINDDEEVPMSNFVGRLILQSIFVLSIFSPYIANI